MDDDYIVFEIIFSAYRLISDLKKISNVYIKEFCMFLTICKNNKIDLNYPFYEFSKIVNIINDNKYFKNNINEIFNNKKKLSFNKKYDKSLQDFFIKIMKEKFNHDSQCNLIKNVSIDLKFGMNIFDRINISNILTVKDIFNNLQNKNLEFNKLNINNLLFYKDKKHITITDFLIEHDIEDDDCINITIKQ
jgi:hypothetical protein